MTAFPSFPTGAVESIAKVIGNAGSGTDIDRYFQENGIDDNSGESTKWRRLNSVFLFSQKMTKRRCGQSLGLFLETGGCPCTQERKE